MGETKQINIKNRTYYFYNDSVNPLYLMINEKICHFEEKHENKYLVWDEIDENKVLEKYEEVWENIKKETETTNGGKKIEYGKDF